MTILDTFTLDFKTNIPASAQKDIAALDKQIDELGKRGKKRDDEENRRYTDLKKQRKDLIDQTREQQRETEKLGNTFQDMIGNAVGAVTAYASFSALKSALVDANNLNKALKILGDTYGIDAVKVKAYGAAVERSTGISPDVFYDFVLQNAAAARAKRLPFNLDQFVANARNNLKNYPKGQAPAGIQQVPGEERLLPFFQLSEEDYRKANAEGRNVAGTQADLDAAAANSEAAAKTAQEFSKIATQIDTNFTGAVQQFNEAVQSFVGGFSGHPTAALSTGIAASIATLFFGKKAAGAALRGVGLLGSAAPIGAGTAAAGVGLTFPALVAASFYETFFGDPEEAGVAFGNLFKGGNTSSPSPPPPSSPSVVPSGTAKTNKERIYDFWISQGYSPAAAAGWTANAQAESTFNPLAGLGTSYVGLYQWSAKRRAEILTGTGIDVVNAALDDQLKAAAWEAQQNKYGLIPSAFPAGAGPSAALISNKFEVPSLTTQGLAAEAAKRARIAEGYNIPLTPSADTAGAGRVINVKIDDIKIETQATDSAGIAREVGVELQNQIRMAMSNFDDGVSA